MSEGLFASESATGTALQPLNFEGQTVGVMEIGGAAWFVAPDLARVLAHNNAARIMRLLDDERGVHKCDTLGGPQLLSIVSEPRLYRAVVQRRASKKIGPDLLVRVLQFPCGMFHAVLPSIRKIGG